MKRRIINERLVKILDAALAHHNINVYCAEDFLTATIEVFQNMTFDSELIKQIQHVTGNPEPNKWCIDIAQAALAYVEVKRGVKSKIACHYKVLEVWDRTPVNLRVYDYPNYADWVIWRHRKTEDGHAGVVTAIGLQNRFKVMEGNVKSGRFDKKGVEKGLIGVWPHRRRRSGSPQMDILGFLRPFP